MKKEELRALYSSNTKPDGTPEVLSVFHLKFSGLVKLEAETEAWGGTDDPTWIKTNKNICKKLPGSKATKSYITYWL